MRCASQRTDLPTASRLLEEAAPRGDPRSPMGRRDAIDRFKVPPTVAPAAREFGGWRQPDLRATALSCDVHVDPPHRGRPQRSRTGSRARDAQSAPPGNTVAPCVTADTRKSAIHAWPMTRALRRG